jgi:hypothetical protein
MGFNIILSVCHWLVPLVILPDIYTADKLSTVFLLFLSASSSRSCNSICRFSSFRTHNWTWKKFVHVLNTHRYKHTTRLYLPSPSSSPLHRLKYGIPQFLYTASIKYLTPDQDMYICRDVCMNERIRAPFCGNMRIQTKFYGSSYFIWSSFIYRAVACRAVTMQRPRDKQIYQSCF